MDFTLSGQSINLSLFLMTNWEFKGWLIPLIKSKMLNELMKKETSKNAVPVTVVAIYMLPYIGSRVAFICEIDKTLN